MGDRIGTAPPSGIGDMLISSRSSAEYRAMFGLGRADAGKRVLDCPGGAAAFTAGAGSLGLDAWACDPVYERLDAAELAATAMAESARGNAYVRSHPDEYVWTFFSDADEHIAHRDAAATAFREHRTRFPQRYVPAALPSLPFAGAAFDLALCSHLLFSYADRLDLAFHRAALRELCRVAREVRVFPLVAMGSSTRLELDELLTSLGAGYTWSIRPADYEFQRGGHECLVLSQDASG